MSMSEQNPDALQRYSTKPVKYAWRSTGHFSKQQIIFSSILGLIAAPIAYALGLAPSIRMGVLAVLIVTAIALFLAALYNFLRTRALIHREQQEEILALRNRVPVPLQPAPAPARRRCDMPFTAYALVKNLGSSGDELQFQDFCLRKLRAGRRAEVDEARKTFPRGRVSFGDWVYERIYQQPPPVAQGQQDIGFGRIPSQSEDDLLIFRLFKVGDICFSEQSIRSPDGTLNTQYPYWAISDVNTTLRYSMDQDDCASWDALALELPTCEGWNSTWFQTARRFFLSGGAKEFNLHWDIVDRIVDYMVALEAVLSTDKDYLRRQLSQRGSRLLNPAAPEECARLIKRFYDVRSTIAHGSKLSERDKDYIRNSRSDFEAVVRSVLIAALRTLPSDDADQKRRLTVLFDVSDEDLANKVEEIFSRITNDEEKGRLIARLNNL